MASKIVLFYNQGQTGWTETYYSNYTVAQIDPYTAGWKKFLTARVALFGGPTSIYGMRVSTEGNAREAYFWPFFNIWAPYAPTAGAVTNTPTVVSVDAQLSLFDPTTKKRNLWIRGLAASLVTRDLQGFMIYNPTLQKLIQNLVSAMQDSTVNLQIRSLVAPPAAGLFYMQAIKLQQNAANAHWTDILTNIAPNFVIANQPQARFLGVPHDDLPGFPRQALVVAQSAIAPFTVTIPYRFRALAPVTPPKMTLTQLAFLYTPISFQQFERFSDHKTGRPFGTLRGRARALVTAQ